MKSKRKICVVTSGRADYGHLQTLIAEIKSDADLQLQLVVTGMHLATQFGETYKFIERDGFKIDEKVDVLKFDNSVMGMTKTFGYTSQLFAETFHKIKPDIVVLLGDRYEILACAVAAYFARIPIAHIHGGEVTEGVIDEAMRHSITKMSAIHFATTEEYRNRVIQLGENPRYVYNFGAPCLDTIYKIEKISRDELARRLDFDFGQPVALVTYHPVTLDNKNPQMQVEALLKAVEKTSFNYIFTKANVDSGGETINQMIATLCRKKSTQCKLYDNLGQFLYYNCMHHCAFMLGNSSSAIIESPSFALPAINVGDRQRNRILADNIVSVADTTKAILDGIKKVRSVDFVQKCQRVKNPYDKYHDGSVSRRIKDVLKKITLSDKLIKKHFYDLPKKF